jgi:hypothetical protein
MAVMPKEATVKLHLDTSDALERIAEFPDEVLDRLADKLTDRVIKRIRQQERLEGKS